MKNVGSKLISLESLDLALQQSKITDPGDICAEEQGEDSSGILFCVGKLLKGTMFSFSKLECVNQIRTCRIPEEATDALLEQAAISDDDKIRSNGAGH
ncbi:unnamed protein product [Caenorhabditis auriculariae]|uniref:Uncharacterized protein n=1 Tax=Caenorhabditis auriculariae TaxID=2777116 RepID=A0A8S1HC99_9PELO|nr:unnamed protein product [Caenorhabditis auriculariae]